MTATTALQTTQKKEQPNKLTIERLQALRKDQELIAMVALWTTLKAKAEVKREQIDKVYNNVLKQYPFYYEDRHPKAGQLVTDHNAVGVYTSEDVTTQHFKNYMNACQYAVKTLGMMKGIKPGCCPALTAESEARDIRFKIVERVRLYFGMPEVWNMKDRNKLFEITFGIIGDEVKKFLIESGAPINV